ncbi:MAG: undecaprenyl/decaprenyl-phosphate alpha-N-acetylglucosaminyl 1-phosphate transferase [Nitrosomonas sp.]|nr:undecaprenyl/decaprenyl-phosphate alpha-N-acetylglucosaminyl 1-phosphate transferase [Nitrosomonas sp.]
MSIIIIRFAIFLMLTLSIADHPDDDHKLHDISTPFVGGVGVLAALCLALVVLINLYSEHFQECLVLGLCSIIIFVTGFVDDTIKLSYKPRFFIQAIVALTMVFGGGVVLSDLGGLLFGFPLQLGILGVAFTVFATIGGINALNMIDGIDGLSGSISLISLLLIGIVAFIAGDQHNLILITTLAGGVVGFLYFNLRYPSQRHARVFLGDNGSMLLGLMFAWLLVDLSQGSNPALTPVTAIWLFSVPLMDTISVMLRRMCMGQSPFKPDRQHLHHLLMKAGFRVTEIVFVVALLHSLLGIIGLTGLYMGVSEFAMLLGFLLISIGYFFLTYRSWRFVSMLRNLDILLDTRFGFAPVADYGVLSGSYTAKDIESLTKITSKGLGPDSDFWLRIFEQSSTNDNSIRYYAVTLHIQPNKENCASKEKLEQYVTLLQQRLKEQRGIQLHHFVKRHIDFNPAIYSSGSVDSESRIARQPRLDRQVLEFEITRCK